MDFHKKVGFLIWINIVQIITSLNWASEVANTWHMWISPGKINNHSIIIIVINIAIHKASPKDVGFALFSNYPNTHHIPPTGKRKVMGPMKVKFGVKLNKMWGKIT